MFDRTSLYLPSLQSKQERFIICTKSTYDPTSFAVSATLPVTISIIVDCSPLMIYRSTSPNTWELLVQA